MTDHTELRKLAEQAKYNAQGSDWYAAANLQCDGFEWSTSALIEALEPDQVIALLDEIKELRSSNGLLEIELKAERQTSAQLSEELTQLRAELEQCKKDALVAGDHEAMQTLLHHEQDENMRLRALLNTPHTDDWFEGVRIEAAHQINRWGVAHDAGKSPPDWYWLIGYLAGKALAAAISGNHDKAKHHTISTAAVLLNWFRAITGDSNAMRPGIEPPAALSNETEEKKE